MLKAIIYTKPACQGCNATKRKCRKIGMPYEERQIFDHPGVLKALKEMNWTLMPYVQITDEKGIYFDHWTGFKPERLDKWAAEDPAA